MRPRNFRGRVRGHNAAVMAALEPVEINSDLFSTSEPGPTELCSVVDPPRESTPPPHDGVDLITFHVDINFWDFIMAMPLELFLEYLQHINYGFAVELP